MLVATVLALTAAVLHAGWNFIAKRSIDPFLALWGQFLLAGLGSAVVVAVTRDLPLEAWGWAALTGVVHVPYVVGLGWAYRHGDFSLAYPVARGGGALLAAVGGVLLLDDDLGPLSFAAIGLVVAGMMILAVGAARQQVLVALLVAATIGTYTVIDSHAARTYDGVTYVFATFVTTAVTVTLAGLVSGRGPDLLRVPVPAWRRMGLAAAMSVATYALVLLAVRRAPVGYVAALRESSVLIAALLGWRVLGEGRGRVRTVAAVVMVTGLVLLVATG